MLHLAKYALLTAFTLNSCACTTASAQNISDSLATKLRNASTDSVRARTILDIGESQEATSLESSMHYYNMALAIAERIKNNHLILSSVNDMGIAYIEMNKLDSAIPAFQRALEVAHDLHDTLRMAKITGNIGNVYFHQHKRLPALEFYLKAASLCEKINANSDMPALYSNLCSLFSDEKEFTRAIEYGSKAVQMADLNGDEYSKVNALINLSGVYGNMHQPEQQLALLNKALPLANKNKDIEQIATIYHDLGTYYFSKKDYRRSLEQYLHSFSFVQQLNNQIHLCTAYSTLSTVYMKLGDKANALKNILLAEDLANKVGARANLKDIYQTRAEIEQLNGNFEQSAGYFSRRIILSDSLFNVETSEKIADVEAKYQNEIKQHEITSLQNERSIQALSLTQKEVYNYYLIALVGLLLLIGFVGYRNLLHRQQLARQNSELQKQQISELEKDKRLVAADSMMKGEENERSRLAKDLHDGLGGLLSGVKFTLSNMKDNLIITPDNQAVFERSLDMLDTSIKELRRVAHNMMPEMLVKFGLDETIKEYCISINATQLVAVKYQSVGLASRLDSSMEIIIYRILQELLNNVLKHASATDVLVQVVKEEKRLSIIVEDNGRGFDTAVLNSNKATGFSSIRSRVEYLNGQMEVNSEPGKGTLVNIEFNLNT